MDTSGLPLDTIYAELETMQLLYLQMQLKKFYQKVFHHENMNWKIN